MSNFFNRARHKLNDFACGFNKTIEEDVPTFGEPVYVNVYDLHWANGYTKPIGIGIYHSGVQVYGKEYGFGGHPYESSGIFEIEPQNSHQMGEEFTYNQTIFVGYTYFKPTCVERFLADIEDEFAGSSYHLLRHNCNHFSNRLINFLCNESLPSWINRIASMVSSFSFLENMIPQEYMRPLSQQDFESSLDIHGSAVQFDNVIVSSIKDINGTSVDFEATEEKTRESEQHENRICSKNDKEKIPIRPNTTFNTDVSSPASTYSKSKA